MSVSTPRSGSTTSGTQSSATLLGPTSTAETDPGFEPRSEIVTVGGQRLAIERRGSGRPLLLINGIGATGQLFEPFQAAMWHHDRRETITFDAPGIGRSPAPLFPPTMRRLAATVAEMITALGYDQVDVLGLSWGGALAQELAYRHPDRVGKVVLAATMHGWTSMPGRPAALAILMTPARYYSAAYLKQVAPTLYGGMIRDQPDLLSEHARVRASRPPSPVGYLWQMAALRRWTSLPWLHRLAAPTLVLTGDDDPIIPLINAKTTAARLPNGELHVVEGGGHLFLYLQAEAIAERVLEFLDAS